VTPFPTVRHRWEARDAAESSLGGLGSSAVDRSELGIELYVEAGGDFEPRILEHMRAAATAPCHHAFITRP